MRLYTEGSSWFSGDEGKKGRIAAGQLADMSVLSADYFTVPEEEIKGIEAVLTIMGGKVVHGAEEYGNLAPAIAANQPGLVADRSLWRRISPYSWEPCRIITGIRVRLQQSTPSAHAHRHWRQR